ncbi:hypothetical protein D3C87_1869250 [compost metagenome]
MSSIDSRTDARDCCRAAPSASAAIPAACATLLMPKWLRMRLKAEMLRASPKT